MPWRVVADHPSCPASKPFGVVNKQTGQLERGGCHETREMANRQLAALYAKEPQMQRSNLLFGAEWKAVGGDSGELEGYVSIFGNVDQGGDVVLPGAFKRTLDQWSRSKNPLPLIADHDLTTDGVIGSVVEAKEDQVGVRVHARFSSDPKAQSIRTKMIEGHLSGMSFTYELVKHYVGQIAGKSVRFLQEVKLFEATVTPFPMNQLALASAKTDTTVKPTNLDFDMFRESMAKVIDMPDPFARKMVIDFLVARYRPAISAPELADEPFTADAPDHIDDTSPVGTAIGDPLIQIKVDRQNAQADRLEAAINRAKEANRR